MEDNEFSSSSNKEDREPKKIALKVPSLFIKTTPNTGSDSGSSKQNDGSASKKVSRPMPASARKKLEESKKEEEKADEKTNDSSSVTSNGSGSSSQKNTTSRAMPASARRKLEEEKSSESVEPVTSVTPVTNKEVKKPMPASMKRKLEEAAKTENKEGSSGSDISSASKDTSTQNQKTVSKPMPASARRKHEETTAEEKTIVRDDDDRSNTSGKGGRVSSIGSTTSSTTKASRPMPASARRKIEMEKEFSEVTENSPQTDENVPRIDTAKKSTSRPGPASAKRKAEESNSGGLKNAGDSSPNVNTSDNVIKEADGNTTTASKRPMPASARRKLEETDTSKDSNEIKSTAVDSVDTAKPANKITISLDGIKFPKFSKPMPASAKRKVEDQEATTNKDRDDLNTSEQFETTINEGHKSDGADERQETGRTRRSGQSVKMLTSLITEKFPCQFCGQEFYKLGSKNSHEKKMHIEKKEKDHDAEKARKPSSSKSSKQKGRKYPDNKCPKCNIVIKNRKKLVRHVYNCGKPLAFSCEYCDKKFPARGKLATHLNTHIKAISVEETSQDFPRRSSKSDYGSPVPSHMSVASNGGSSKSSKESVVEKTKPIPESVRAKLDLKDTPSRSGYDSSNRNSFKRKIADVLSNLESHNLSITTKNNESDEEAEQEPPLKKTILSDGPESIKGRPMPASVRKKLERRTTPKESVSPSKIKKSSETKEIFNKTGQSSSGHGKNASYDTSDLDPCECEVCHRMFSAVHNRIRHERSVHSISEPRSKTTPTTPTSTIPTPTSATPVVDSTEESDNPVPDLDPELMKQHGADFDLNSVPVTGRCPICQKFENRLRGHLKTSHKIGTYNAPAVKSSPVNAPTTTRLTAPKSYKIYKTTAKKAMQKLTTGTSASSSKPVVSLEKVTVKGTSSLHQKISTTKTEPGTEQSVSTNRCSCCDETFEFQGDFNKHMEMRHPNRKRVITCKICRHMFSHEEDFIIHIRFKHKDVVSGNEQTPDTHSKSKPPKDEPQQRTKSHSSTQQSGRSTRTSALTRGHTVDHPQQSPKSTPSKYEIEYAVKDCTVGISFKDREVAEKGNSAHKTENSTTTVTEHLDRSERSKRRSTLRARTPSPEPEVMDTTYGSDNYDDDMEVDPDPIADIAITSTFSQRPPSPKKNALGLDEMPCSTCTEVFYSYEALRKHELYFHNVKTSKMCPICGVYPTKLSRHLLAHENKTVRCCCAPCHLSFQNFSELLKHNLSKHPGPDGGALCAANKNKPRSVTNDSSTSTPSEIVQENKTVSISCKICSSSFITMRQAKQHVWRVHPERTEDVEVYLENSCDNEKESSNNLSRIESNTKSDDTVVTIDSDDENSRNQSKRPARPVPASVRAKLKDAMERDAENKPKPSRPMPASARAKLEKSNDDSKPQSNRPMPASARSKLQSQKSVDEDKAEITPLPSRPMPASARARLQDSFEVDSSESERSGAVSKPKRPMPVSVKAKLQKSMEFVANEEGNKEKPKPSRPMPASVRAKMNRENTSEQEKEDSDSQSGSTLSKSMSALAGHSKHRGPMPASVRAKLMGNNSAIKTDHDRVDENDSAPDDLDDDRDDIPSDVEQDNNEQRSFIEGAVGEVTSQEEIHDDDDDEYIPEPSPHSIPTFSIADEIAEHDRAVRMAMGDEVPKGPECKVCNKKFDLIDSVLRHIRRVHREYGSEQVEDLIEYGYASAGHSLRTRKPNVRYNYNEDDEEEEEEQVIPYNKKRSQGLNTSVSNNSVIPENCAFACKFCRKRCTSIANVKRHIGQSHRHISAEARNNGVLFLEMENANNGESAWSGDASKDDGVPLFSCTYCSYRSTDEDEYVRHHKTHTGESPYVCQYCSARFPRSQKLEAHVQREHSGAEILNSEEPEICMEDMVTVAQISVSTSSRIQIDSPQTVSLDRRFSHESNGHSNEKRTPAGPKSTKAVTKEVDPMLAATSADDDEDSGPSSSPSKDKDNEESAQTSKDPVGYTYQADLSSLFPSLREAPSGLDALDDIDGGMSLD